MFICEYCNKNFDCNKKLEVHLNKNTKCYEPKKTKKDYTYTFNCSFCSKIFKRKDYMNNHIEKYHKMELEVNKKVEEKLDELKEEMQDIKKVLVNNKPTINNIVNNINNNINNGSITNNNMINSNNKKVNVKAYSQENDSYITDEIMDSCVKNPYEGIVILTKLVNYDENHPENFNIFLNNKKKKEISFYDNEKWVKRDLKSALNYIFNTQTDRIGEYMDAHPEKYSKEKGFTDNILHVIMQIETHDTKMKHDSHYRNLVNNLYKVMEDNKYKVINAMKRKQVENKKGEVIEVNYKVFKGWATCVPLYLEPTPIT